MHRNQTTLKKNACAIPEIEKQREDTTSLRSRTKDMSSLFFFPFFFTQTKKNDINHQATTKTLFIFKKIQKPRPRNFSRRTRKLKKTENKKMKKKKKKQIGRFKKSI